MELVFATHNLNKLNEIQILLPENYSLLSLNSIGCTEDIPETGLSLEDNARLKATYVYDNYRQNCFADDTGLLVDALNGAPGILSARYAGNHKNADDNINKVLDHLSKSDNRSARFVTIIALYMASKLHLFEGVVEGTITSERKGDLGFGYDPIFQPLGYSRTFAEMPLVLKNKISHRGRAFRKLIKFLSDHEQQASNGSSK